LSSAQSLSVERNQEAPSTNVEVIEDIRVSNDGTEAISSDNMKGLEVVSHNDTTLVNTTEVISDMKALEDYSHNDATLVDTTVAISSDNTKVVEVISHSSMDGEIARENIISFKEGDKIEGNYCSRGKWYPGWITKDRGNGTYDIVYDDGDEESRIDKTLIRLLKSTEVNETEDYSESEILEEIMKNDLNKDINNNYDEDEFDFDHSSR
jgi:hypothetical protein